MTDSVFDASRRAGWRTVDWRREDVGGDWIETWRVLERDGAGGRELAAIRTSVEWNPPGDVSLPAHDLCLAYEDGKRSQFVLRAEGEDAKSLEGVDRLYATCGGSQREILPVATRLVGREAYMVGLWPDHMNNQARFESDMAAPKTSWPVFRLETATNSWHAIVNAWTADSVLRTLLLFDLRAGGFIPPSPFPRWKTGSGFVPDDEDLAAA